MCLWAVYKDIIRKITYYPTVGYAWTNKIKDTFRLDDSGIPGFAGWTVNGKFYAKSSDDFSKPLTVDTDYVALMSCYSSYTLSYDSNSGTGTMPSYSSSCATYVNDTLEVKTTAEEVALGECEF